MIAILVQTNSHDWSRKNRTGIKPILSNRLTNELEKNERPVPRKIREYLQHRRKWSHHHCQLHPESSSPRQAFVWRSSFDLAGVANVFLASRLFHIDGTRRIRHTIDNFSVSNRLAPTVRVHCAMSPDPHRSVPLDKWQDWAQAPPRRSYSFCTKVNASRHHWQSHNLFHCITMKSTKSR